MGWTVWGDVFESGQLSDTSMFCSVSFGENIILRAMRTWVIAYNDPTFTDLSMKIYSNEPVGGYNTPKKLLYTSTDVRTKAEILTLENGVKEIYFTFDDEPINGNDIYNVVLSGSGYVPTGSSYLAWMKAWPDPVYASGFTPTYENLMVAPYQIYAIGGRF